MGWIPPAHPLGRSLCSPDAHGSTAWRLSQSSLQRENPGHRGAEPYPSELCEKWHFFSCWRTTLITSRYLLTFQGARGAPLLTGSAPTAPSLPQTGAGCLWARLPTNLLFTCCQLTHEALVISGASKSLAKQKRGQQYLYVWAGICLSVQAGCSWQ